LYDYSDPRDNDWNYAKTTVSIYRVESVQSRCLASRSNG